MRVYVNLNVLFAPFAFFWFGMAGVSFFHFRAKQREYLQHFVSEGISLDVPPGSIDAFKVRQAKYYVMFHRQTDPELEQLRCDAWRRYGLFVLSIFGFPLCVIAILMLLGISGLVHYR